VVSGGAGIAGALNVSGGMTVTPNATAPTSNVTIGPAAGSSLLVSGGNIALGQDALKLFTGGANAITNTVAGTTSTDGTNASVLLEKASGSGDMTVYPTVTLVVTAGAVVAINVDVPGSGATVASGLVFKTSDARIDPNWRGTLSSVTGQNVAIGNGALGTNSAGRNNTAIGASAMASLTSGEFNAACGESAMTANTTGSNNCALGRAALNPNTTGSGNVAIGGNAGRFHGSGTDNLTVANNSVFVGVGSRAAADSQSNQVVIGNGALGNSDTTGTFIAGTATSRFTVNGDTMRIVGTRTPASNAAGTAGDFAFGSTGGTTYLYYCIASGNWGRVALTTGY
jgi:hypothetical protein